MRISPELGWGLISGDSMGDGCWGFSPSSILGLREDLRKDLQPGALPSPNKEAEEPLACKPHGLKCERVLLAQPFRTGDNPEAFVQSSGS